MVQPGKQQSGSCSVQSAVILEGLLDDAQKTYFPKTPGTRTGSTGNLQPTLNWPGGVNLLGDDSQPTMVLDVSDRR